MVVLAVLKAMHIGVLPFMKSHLNLYYTTMLSRDVSSSGYDWSLIEFQNNATL